MLQQPSLSTTSTTSTAHCTTTFSNPQQPSTVNNPLDNSTLYDNLQQPSTTIDSQQPVGQQHQQSSITTSIENHHKQQHRQPHIWTTNPTTATTFEDRCLLNHKIASPNSGCADCGSHDIVYGKLRFAFLRSLSAALSSVKVK
jgi:hypothetical protein